MLLISNQSNTSHLSDFESTVITPWTVLQSVVVIVLLFNKLDSELKVSTG